MWAPGAQFFCCCGDPQKLHPAKHRRKKKNRHSTSNPQLQASFRWATAPSHCAPSLVLLYRWNPLPPATLYCLCQSLKTQPRLRLLFCCLPVRGSPSLTLSRSLAESRRNLHRRLNFLCAVRLFGPAQSNSSEAPTIPSLAGYGHSTLQTNRRQQHQPPTLQHQLPVVHSDALQARLAPSSQPHARLCVTHPVAPYHPLSFPPTFSLALIESSVAT